MGPLGPMGPRLHNGPCINPLQRNKRETPIYIYICKQFYIHSSLSVKYQMVCANQKGKGGQLEIPEILYFGRLNLLKHNERVSWRCLNLFFCFKGLEAEGNGAILAQLRLRRNVVSSPDEPLPLIASHRWSCLGRA